MIAVPLASNPSSEMTAKAELLKAQCIFFDMLESGCYCSKDRSAAAAQTTRPIYALDTV